MVYMSMSTPYIVYCCILGLMVLYPCKNFVLVFILVNICFFLSKYPLIDHAKTKIYEKAFLKMAY